VQLLPRDDKFFDLLAEQSAIALQASQLLAKGIRGTDSLGTAQRVRDMERKGVRWGVATNIMWALVLTIPASALVAGGIVAVIRMFNAQA
jgi:phosphate/sulfate permease